MANVNKRVDLKAQEKNKFVIFYPLLELMSGGMVRKSKSLFSDQ